MLTSLIGELGMSLQKPRRPRLGYSLRTRLYTIIGFLGLLPVIGVAFALVALANSTRNDAALDRAVRGTIHLERINGLVYAVVMESRGIYMSANWKTAEPFAQNLIRDLPRLQEVARTWKAEAIASQQSNVEELTERIDQFVRFRTELVRLGEEESTAAARLPPILSKYHGLYPEVQVELATGTSGALVNRVCAQELEAAFVAEPFNAAGLDTRLAFERDALYPIAGFDRKTAGSQNSLEKYCAVGPGFLARDSLRMLETL